MAETNNVTTDRLLYFPLSAKSVGHRMDTRTGVTSLIQVEADKYRAQCAEKATLLKSAPDYHFQCPPEFLPFAWEALEVLLPDAAAHHPQHFTLETDGDNWNWTNRLCGLRQSFTLGDDASLPLPVLDWLGRQFQEDLILMQQEGDHPATLAAGHLCFAAGWCLEDKRNQPFLAIHAPIPGFVEEIGTPADKLMRRLKADRPVERINWSLSGSAHLDRSPLKTPLLRAAEAGIRAENVPDRVYFRVERQTLTRLPRTGAILFTIHTYLNPLRDVLNDAERARRLHRAVAGYSDATIEYKGITGYHDALMACLARAASFDSGNA